MFIFFALLSPSHLSPSPPASLHSILSLKNSTAQNSTASPDSRCPSVPAPPVVPISYRIWPFNITADFLRRRLLSPAFLTIAPPPPTKHAAPPSLSASAPLLLSKLVPPQPAFRRFLPSLSSFKTSLLPSMVIDRPSRCAATIIAACTPSAASSKPSPFTPPLFQPISRRRRLLQLFRSKLRRRCAPPFSRSLFDPPDLPKSPPPVLTRPKSRRTAVVLQRPPPFAITPPPDALRLCSRLSAAIHRRRCCSPPEKLPPFSSKISTVVSSHSCRRIAVRRRRSIARRLHSLLLPNIQMKWVKSIDRVDLVG